jgi:integrase
MKAAAGFASLMAPDIERYLTLKQALGREYDGVRRVLAHVDMFVTTRGGDLTSDTFAGWCLTLQHLASGTRRSRMREVRNFCLYRRRSEPGSFLPDARLFPPRHQLVRPHLFTNDEVVRLLAIISDLPAARTSPFRRENLRLAIALLYTTGLRLGELVRLTLGDYDLREHTLLIRESKFHKSRLVPLSTDGITRSVSRCPPRPTDRRLAGESPALAPHSAWNRLHRHRAY